jgi:hypothetical protein
MEVTATKNYSKAIFTWNDELTECTHVAINISDEELQCLINAKAHEGNDLEGWNITIK